MAPSPSQPTRDRVPEISAYAVRRLLVESSRCGARAQRAAVPGLALPGTAERVGLLELDAALERLQRIDPVLVRAAELRLFGGMSLEGMAACLELTPVRARVVWASTRAVLRKLLIAPTDVPDPGPRS